MTDRDALLALNQALYRAFNDRDIAAMRALWAARLPVSCAHPGWVALVGREAVLASWADILRAPVPAGPAGPSIRVRNERVILYGDTAMVLCEEMLGEAVLACVNLFAREDGAWRLVHHQSGPVADPRASVRSPADEPPPRRLH